MNESALLNQVYQFLTSWWQPLESVNNVDNETHHCVIIVLAPGRWIRCHLNDTQWLNLESDPAVQRIIYVVSFPPGAQLRFAQHLVSTVDSARLEMWLADHPLRMLHDLISSDTPGQYLQHMPYATERDFTFVGGFVEE